MRNLKYITLSLLLSATILTFSMDNNNYIEEARKELLGLKLVQAAQSGDFEEATKLIKDGANVNARNFFKDTPLIAACCCTSKYKPKGFAYRISTANDEVSLEPIRINSDFPIAKLLIDNGADVFLKSCKGNTALKIALKEKKPEIVKLIGQAKIKIHNLIKILTQAIKNNDKQEIKDLLLKNPRLTDKDGNNALHIAAKDSNYLMFNYIWLIKPELFDKKNYDNKTAIDEHLEMILFLILNKRLELVEQK